MADLVEGSHRPVDEAMSADRPAKRCVRDLWVEVVRERKRRTPVDVPFYLTMPGASAMDIQLLIDRGVIETTEAGMIADTDNRRVVAVEKDGPAILAIQRRFPGLKVLERNVLDELRGASPVAFPEGPQRRLFRATVINLDFNGPLLYREPAFPVLEAIAKLATLHTVPTPIDWTLLLTLLAEIPWSATVQQNAQRFLAEQCSLHTHLSEGCHALLGEELHGRLLADEPVDLGALSSTEQQALLMALVPVRIAHRVHTTGWRIDITRNLRYGGEAGTAPMVTWIVGFIADPRASATPHRVLSEGLDTVLSAAGHITADGTLIGLR